MRHFKKENCKVKARGHYMSKNGFEVKITGRHAFEWTAEIRSTYCFFSITFPNREECMREVRNKYPKTTIKK